MNFPCPNKSDCTNPAGDNAVINETAELPDALKFFSIYWPPIGTPGFDPTPGAVPVGNLCEGDTQESADLCALKGAFPPDKGPSLFPNTAQECSLTCSDGSVVSFITPAGLFYSSSLATANAQASQFACAAAQIFCSTSRPRSTEQTCDFLCADESTSSYTVAAGAFMGATQADADAASYSFACLIASLLCDGPLPTLFSSQAQSCTLTCPSGEIVTVTVPAGAALGLSQAEADASAHALACGLATLSCNNVPALATNTSQTCTQTCGGIPVSYTVPAGAFFGVDQASANFAAFAFACQAVALTCTTGEPTPPILVGNQPQTCPIACPGGGTFVFTLSANEVRAENQAAANAQAASIACIIGQNERVCLSAIQTEVCVNTAYASLITADGSTGPIVKTSGTLPPGITLSGGLLSGTPTATGTYSFTVQANTANGYVTRTYAIAVAGITTSALPAAENDVPYVAGLSESGLSGATWSVSGGTLPPGLTLSADGVISGTPSGASGTYSFVVTAQT